MNMQKIISRMNQRCIFHSEIGSENSLKIANEWQTHQIKNNFQSMAMLFCKYVLKKIIVLVLDS